MSSINVDKVLRTIGENAKDKFMLQIGAMDGVSFDDIRGYTNLFRWSGLFVEPNPDMYIRMVDSYSNHDNVKFEKSAISDYNGEITMLRIPPDVVDSGRVHSCFNGMTAVWPPKNGLGSEGDKPVVDEFGEKINVPCLTLDALLKKHNVTQIDILAIDAEGHDWTIFKQLDLTKYRPSFIKVEYINLTDSEKEQIRSKLKAAGYKYSISGQDINAVPEEQHQSVDVTIPPVLSTQEPVVRPDNLTVVTGIWDLSRSSAGDGFKRSFDFYINNLTKLLQADVPMIVYIEKQYQAIVEDARKDKMDITDIRIKEVDHFKNVPEFDQIQTIRKSPAWLAQAGWLKESTQGSLEMYNPMVMSKMFMLNDAAIWNPFGTEYFAWIDGGITNTVHPGYFTHDKVFDKVTPYLNKFFFISFPYKTGPEIHGFPREEMNRYSDTENVEYVCRGGFFGGHVNSIREANAHYYAVLQDSLQSGFMGTEESVFTIMSYQRPELYNRYMIDGNGLINKFFETVKNNKVKIEKTLVKANSNPLNVDVNNVKTNLYVITFNSPRQFEALLQSYSTQPEFLSQTEKFVVNNSTDRSTDAEYDRICKQYDFTQIKKNNIGICGGRQFVAEHFDQSDADFYIFLEDDMMLKSINSEPCKNGLTGSTPNLFTNVQRIIISEGYDFLKFSFTEFFGDNSTQWAWYNVPSNFRVQHWPENPRLPRQGLDKNAPKTKFNTIKSINGLTYADGEVYYCNWPQIVSRPGNKKMFLDTTWAHPHEQTWMSYMFQKTIEGKLKGAVLLASPINHNRFDHYDSELRVES